MGPSLNGDRERKRFVGGGRTPDCVRTSITRVDAVALGLVAAATLAGVVLWTHLPARLAIHWSGGHPDGYASKSVALFGIAALGVVAIAFVRLLPESATSAPGGDDAAVLVVGLTIAWSQAVVVAWNLGYRFDVRLATVALLLAVCLILWVGVRGALPTR